MSVFDMRRPMIHLTDASWRAQQFRLCIIGALALFVVGALLMIADASSCGM